MRICTVVLFVVFVLCRFTADGAQTAVGRMFCLSARFSQAVTPDGVALDFSTSSSMINGELAPFESQGYDCISTIILNDPAYGFPIPGTLFLNLPELADSNQDGADDFFDTTCSVSGGSIGTYEFAFLRSGWVSASWEREAGSTNGTCVVTLEEFGSFTHAFEILEYRGALSYTPGVSSVEAVLAVARTGAAEETLSGLLQFNKSALAPELMLELVSGSLTNSGGEVFPYSSFAGYTFDWYPDRPTNYWGYIDFADGNLATVEEDYDWWILSIDDVNDSDGDSVPDFSDTPTAGRKAVLSLGQGTNGVTLKISADVGTTWKIEKSSSLSGGWTEAVTVPITTVPQAVELPVPQGTTFWRAVKQ